MKKKKGEYILTQNERHYKVNNRITHVVLTKEMALHISTTYHDTMLLCDKLTTENISLKELVRSFCNYTNKKVGEDLL